MFFFSHLASYFRVSWMGRRENDKYGFPWRVDIAVLVLSVSVSQKTVLFVRIDAYVSSNI